jgi:hypothetical protein
VPGDNGIDQRRIARPMGKDSDAISDRHAGTRPAVLHRPLVGLNPINPLKAAGTRPDPAVSVPSAKATSPAATATADPELDPPLT